MDRPGVYSLAMEGPVRESIYNLVIALALAGTASGQGLSTINGSVTDPSGAVVPGARITLTELDTRLSREAVTSPEGLYVVGALRPTRYMLLVEGLGFRSFSQTGITLQADDTVTVNVKMELGATTETIASSEESVGDGERQRAVSMRNRRNFLQVESNDLC